MEQLIKKIEQWGYDKNIHLANPLMQTTKSDEECIELKQAIIRMEELKKEFFNANTSLTVEEYVNKMNKYKEEIKDAIGDIFVTLIMIKIQCDSFRVNINNTISRKRTTKPLHRVKIITDNINVILYKLMANKKSHETGFYIENIIRELTKIANTYNFTLEECVKHSYNQIKDRKGEMKNGLWVKE